MIPEVVAGLAPGSTQQVVGYPSLFLLVAAGALVPVVPTGAVVGSAAVVALHQPSPWAQPAVFLVAAGAAFVGDLALYGLGRRGLNGPRGAGRGRDGGGRGGGKRLARLRERVAPERLESARRALDEHGVTVLVLSRLVPGGRVPVMLACLLGGMTPRRFARGDAPACLAWAGTYQLVGVLGGALFDRPWEGVLAAVALTLLLGGLPGLRRRLRGRREPGEEAAG
ncbi:DedA family protein [Streptomyces sp. URMC 123]|uniref:DedA family protein n=1 Tax=Streptomyces sp. URMC 123 TaxID=3423403 RepID=UPI003F19E051